jgi:tRNA wybutosine-synthesizing protein 2
MFAIKVHKKYAEKIRIFLHKKRLLAQQYYFNSSGDYIYIPITNALNDDVDEVIKSCECKVVKSDFRFKKMHQTPFENIYAVLQKKLDSEYHKYLPRKWELIGDVLILKIPNELERFENQIGRVYATILGAKTVLKQSGGIELIRRKPDVEIIYGLDTETIHKENGVFFKLDTAEIMFSSGNIDERIRISKIAHKDEIVADMFAGIGYFSIPMAVHSQPKKIYASEIFENTYKYLCENIKLNKVSEIVEPLLGDTRYVIPDGIANRVIMGWLDGYKFLDKAIRILNNLEGIIHYHEACHSTLLPRRPVENLKETAAKYHREIKILNFRYVKSYAPHVWHIVVDCKITK